MRSQLRSFSLAAVAVAALCVLAAGASADPLAAGDAKPVGKKLIIFIAGNPSHEYGGHEHRAGCYFLAKCLEENMGDKIVTKVYTGGWPKEANALDGADAIVMYCDGGGGHMALPYLKEIDELAKKGVGVGCLHYGVEPADEKKEPNGRAEFLRWIGGYFESFYSVNPHWVADFKEIPKHAVTSGVHPFRTNDEWYYHMRFRENMQGVTAILSAVPPDITRQGKDDAHGGNPHVREGIGKSIPETTVWVSENGPDANNGRGFGCSGGHVHWNWAQDDFRKTVLNCIVWIAHVDVPADGVPSKTPTVDDLLEHMDTKKVPPTFTKEGKQKEMDALNRRESAAQ